MRLDIEEQKITDEWCDMTNNFIHRNKITPSEIVCCCLSTVYQVFRFHKIEISECKELINKGLDEIIDSFNELDSD